MGPGSVAADRVRDSGPGLSPGSPVPKGMGAGEALLLPPFYYLSPCCENEDQIGMLALHACVPSFSSLSGLGGATYDQACCVWPVREESEHQESAQCAWQV